MSAARILSGIALCASCTAPNPEWSVDLPLVSQYVFRGAVLGDDPVFQPALGVAQELAAGTISGGIWSNIELEDEREATEVDFTVDYSFSVERCDISTGAARYEYPHSDVRASTELYAMVAVSDLALTPTLELWQDIDEIDGTYLNFNLSRDFALDEDWSLSAVFGVGWMDAEQGDGNFGVAESALSDALLALTVSRPISASAVFTGIVAWSRVLDEDYRAAVSDGDNVTLAAGVSFGFGSE